MNEPRYTETEWRRIDALRACAERGHDYEHLEAHGEGLVAVLCSRCGKRWTVKEAA